MCGIIGYIGPKQVTTLLVEGLRRLEYRGYDSAGVAVIGIGVSSGGSVEDDPCNLRETARLLDGIGQRDAAARVMCNDRRAAEALGESICPSIGDRERSTSPLQSQATTGRGQPICDQAARFDDPVLAARNGCR